MATHHKWTDDEKLKVASLYEEDLTYEEIAKRTGFSRNQVAGQVYLMVQDGVISGPRRPCRQKGAADRKPRKDSKFSGVTDEIMTAAIERIKKGRTLLRVAKEFGVCPTTLNVRLNKAGFRMRAERVPLDPEQARAAMTLYMRGDSLKDIAEKVDVLRRERDPHGSLRAKSLVIHAAEKLGYGHYPMRRSLPKRSAPTTIKGMGFMQEGDVKPEPKVDDAPPVKMDERERVTLPVSVIVKSPLHLAADAVAEARKRSDEANLAAANAQSALLSAEQWFRRAMDEASGRSA